jgi:hypothetical protein
MLHAEFAESYDLEGTLFAGGKNSFLQKTFTYNGVSPQEYTIPPVSPIPRSERTSYLMSVQEMGRFIAQLPASISLDMWEYLWNRPDDVYVNTGRPNAPMWRHATERILRQGNVLTRFADMFYRPDGVSGVESKGAAIAELLTKYESVTHYDDDAFVIFSLARQFPQAQFVFVQGLNSGVLMTADEKEKFPNVTRIGALRYEYESSVGTQEAYLVEEIHPSYFELNQTQYREY